MQESFQSAKMQLKRLQKGELCPEELLDTALSRIGEQDPEIGAFLHVDEAGARKAAKELSKPTAALPLAGLPVAVKDNLCTRGVPTTCASRMLEGFIPPYDAFVVSRLRAAGALIVGKTNMDEFGMGSTGEHSAVRPTCNPKDKKRVAGGSSSGSAAAVAAGMTPVALGSDTGGSVRQPAAYCGVVGYKPSYGAVSRSGLIAFASSMDQVGILARTVADIQLLAQVMIERDPQDQTMVDIQPRGSDMLESTYPLQGVRVAYCEEYLKFAAAAVRTRILESVQKLETLGASVECVSLSMTEYLLGMYYILSSAEASSNLARYDGMKYGFSMPDARDADGGVTTCRCAAFGDEVKRRILLGTFVLSAGYYENLSLIHI